MATRKRPRAQQQQQHYAAPVIRQPYARGMKVAKVVSPTMRVEDDAVATLINWLARVEFQQMRQQTRGRPYGA